MSAVDVEDVGEVLRVLVRLAPVETVGITPQSVDTVPEIPAAPPQFPNLS